MNALEQDGALQRFEYTFELSWKLMQSYLSAIGYNDIKGPRPVIKQMVKDNLLNPFIWEEILETRNLLSHSYNKDKSRALLKKITSDFLPEFEAFKNIISRKISEVK